MIFNNIHNKFNVISSSNYNNPFVSCVRNTLFDLSPMFNQKHVSLIFRARTRQSFGRKIRGAIKDLSTSNCHAAQHFTIERHRETTFERDLLPGMVQPDACKPSARLENRENSFTACRHSHFFIPSCSAFSLKTKSWENIFIYDPSRRI